MDHRLFWQNGTGGLLNRADFWETVAPNVHIYLDDILEVDKKLIRLKKGDEVPCDVLAGIRHLSTSLNQNILFNLAYPIFTNTSHLTSQNDGHDLSSMRTKRYLNNFRCWPILQNIFTDLLRLPRIACITPWPLSTMNL